MKQVNLKTLLRKDISEINEYIPGESAVDLSNRYEVSLDKLIKLNANENPYGTAPLVRQAITKTPLNYYPSSNYTKLRKALAKYNNIDAKQIIVGNGSDELIDLLLRLVLEKDEKVINCPPTFGMYEVLVNLNRGRLISVPRNKDYSLNVKAILKQIKDDVKIIFLCNPNNPTGNITSTADIETLLQSDKLLVIDEAYYEFAKITQLKLLNKYPNLIILRTLSKWAGLAGLRIGYAMMDAFLTSQLMKIKLPYTINVAGESAAITALQNLNFFQGLIKKVTDERQRVYRELSVIPALQVYPSYGNFLFVKVKNNNYNKLKKTFEKNKIAIRYYDFPLTPNALRITIGKPEQNNKVVALLKDFAQNKVNFDSIIFDLDGVLVDVNKSYRQAIKMTVEYVLERKFKLKTIVDSKNIEEMKKIAGFNNDWDLSFELIRLLSKGVKRTQFSKKAKQVTSQKSRNYQEIKNIFQSFYLGEKLFYQVYKRKAPINFPKGLITNENLLIDWALLKVLSQEYTLGIATSRPRFEALFALKNLGLTPNLIKEKYIVAQEDSTKEKPAPDSLFSAKIKMGVKNPIYVGDSINDVLAAKNSNILSVYVGKEILGDYQINDVNQLGVIL